MSLNGDRLFRRAHDIAGKFDGQFHSRLYPAERYLIGKAVVGILFRVFLHQYLIAALSYNKRHDIVFRPVIHRMRRRNGQGSVALVPACTDACRRLGESGGGRHHCQSGEQRS